MINRPWIIFCLFILSTHSVQLNLILNGDFSYNHCSENRCTWNLHTYHQNDLYGWLPQPFISIGSGQILNRILGPQKVLQLSQNQNSCVKQVFGSLNSGTYSINLEYTSQQNKQNPQNTPFNLFFNGQLIKTISASSSQLQSQSIQVSIDSFSTNVELKFCGSSTLENDKFGAILTKVEFWGEGKSYLRKQDSILKTYHQLPLRERSARLLQTSASSFSVQTVKVAPGFTASSVPTVSTWTEKPSSSNLKFDTAVVSSWSSNSACNQDSTIKSSWNEKPSTITTDQITSKGWSTNSDCPQDSTIGDKPLWVEKKVASSEPSSTSSNLGSLWNEKPSSIKSDSLVNSGWDSNSNCVKNTQQISSGTMVSLNPASQWVEKTNQGLPPITKVENSGWNSDSNCEKPVDSTVSLWQPKSTSLSSSQPVDPNVAWKTNSNCLEEPKIPATTQQKPKIETKPEITLETLLPPSLPQKINEIPINPNVKIEKPPTITEQPKLTLENPTTPNLPQKINEIPINPNVKIEKPPTITEQPKLTLENPTTPSLPQIKEVAPELTKIINQIPITDTPTLTKTQETVPKPKPTPETLHLITQKPTTGTQPKKSIQEPILPTPSLPQIKQILPEIPTRLTEKSTTEIQPKLPNLQQQRIPTSTPSLPQLNQVVPETPKVSTSKPKNIESLTELKLLNLVNPSPTLITDKSVLSQNGLTNQDPKIQELDHHLSYHEEFAASAPKPTSPTLLLQPPIVENHIVEQLIQKKTSPSENLIANGDFQTYKCAFPPCLISQMVPGSSLSSWIAEPFIEIGKINQYNPSLKASSDNIGAHLGFSTKNSCIKQSLKSLTTNFYELSFDYAPVVPQTSDFVNEAFFIVKFNGKNVKNILCLDKLSHKQSMIVKGMKGENIIEFCAFGSSNENPHGAIIDNVSLVLKPNTQTLKTDFIVNGDFETNECYLKSCLWNQKTFNSKYLPGWLPESEVQIGKGNFYNVHAGISTVAELSPNSNSCIRQVIDNCEKGSFKLTFSWAARQSEALHDSVFQVKVNNHLVQSYIPSDYSLHRENLVLTLNEGKNELKFCSFGMNNDKGAIIDDVSMFFIDSCSVSI